MERPYVITFIHFCCINNSCCWSWSIQQSMFPIFWISVVSETYKLTKLFQESPCTCHSICIEVFHATKLTSFHIFEYVRHVYHFWLYCFYNVDMWVSMINYLIKSSCIHHSRIFVLLLLSYLLIHNICFVFIVNIVFKTYFLHITMIV